MVIRNNSPVGVAVSQPIVRKALNRLGFTAHVVTTNGWATHTYLRRR